MADSSALAGPLDRAGRIFGLAGELGRAFQQEFQGQAAVVNSGNQSPRQRHATRINEFVTAVLDERDVFENPTVELTAVVDQLRNAGRLAKRLSKANVGNILEMWPDLNRVAHDGYEAVEAARECVRPDDPFSIFEETKAKEKPHLVEAFSIVPTLKDVRAKIKITRERMRHPNASHDASNIAADANKNYAAIVHMLDKCGIASPPLPDHRLQPRQIINYLLQALDDIELALNHKTAAIEQMAREYLAEKFGYIRPTLDAVAESLFNPSHFSDVIGEIVAPTEVGNGGSAGGTVAPKKSKRSTERGEGRTKLVAALTRHHKYADGSCLNLEPIGNNELATLAGVSPSTASAFFNKEFDGHTKYRAACGDATRLVAALKLLNQEFSPHHLFGAKPPGEVELDDDE